MIEVHQMIMKNIQSNKWSKDEDQLLRKSIKIHGHRWLQVATYFSNRNASQCSQRWKRIKPQNQRKIYWTEEEDKKILKLYSQYGNQWKLLSQFVPGRSSTSIRSRYMNQLNPKVVHVEFSEQEDSYIYERYVQLGPKWSQIAAGLKGRSSNQVKNRFYNNIRQDFLNIPNPYYIKKSDQTQENTITVDLSYDYDQMSSQMTFYSRQYI